MEPLVGLEPTTVNPACAGMIHGAACRTRTDDRKPRVCGDDPRLAAPLAVLLG